MRYFLFPILILSLLSFSLNTLGEIRANYTKAVSEKELCKRMISELESSKSISAIELGYLGGLQCVWANHVISPITKLSSFNSGKKNIEKAIEMDPQNAELRFIRLSIQKNIPSFLNYHSNLKEDEYWIRKNLDQVKSSIVKKNIQILLNQ